MERKLETALSLVLRDAKPFDEVRAELDPATVAKGIPLHVTLLYPFAPRDELDDALLGDVLVFFAAQAPFELALTRVETFPGTVWAAPEPVEPIRAAIELLRARFPEHPPYGGVFDETIPHATLVTNLPPGEERRVQREVEARLAGCFPRRFRLEAATLLEESAPDRWRERMPLPLAG